MVTKTILDINDKSKPTTQNHLQSHNNVHYFLRLEP